MIKGNGKSSLSLLFCISRCLRCWEGSGYVGYSVNTLPSLRDSSLTISFFFFFIPKYLYFCNILSNRTLHGFCIRKHCIKKGGKIYQIVF